MSKFEVNQTKDGKINLSILRNAVKEELELPWDICQQIYQAVDYQYHKEDIELWIQGNDELDVNDYSQEDIQTLTGYYMDNVAEGTMDRGEAIDLAFLQLSKDKEREKNELEVEFNER